MFKGADDITDKEIMYGIMVSLMRIEGHLSELLLRTDVVDYGGGEDEVERFNQ